MERCDKPKKAPITSWVIGAFPLLWPHPSQIAKPPRSLATYLAHGQHAKRPGLSDADGASACQAGGGGQTSSVQPGGQNFFPTQQGSKPLITKGTEVMTCGWVPIWYVTVADVEMLALLEL